MGAPKKKGWIKKATSNAHGQFKAKAEAAGETTREFAKEKAGAPGKLGQEARLASTLMGMKKRSLYKEKD
jgi:hypothetical protein